MKSYVIHLIRNMPCQGNLEGRYIGRTDSPLADASLGELLELKTKFRYPRATAFYASPSTRCVDTLRILYPEADPEVILEMAECDFGQWEGKTAQELQNDPRFLQWMEEGAQPTQWMCQPGCGYSVRITPSLWMRSMVMEVYQTLPLGEDGQQPDHLVVDIAREAASRAWGQEQQES